MLLVTRSERDSGSVSETSGRLKPQPRYEYPECWSVGKPSRNCESCKLSESVRCPPYDHSPLEY